MKTWKSELRSRTLEALFLMLTPGYLGVTEEDKCVLFLYLLNCEKRILVFVSYLLQNETKNRYLKVSGVSVFIGAESWTNPQ